MTASYECLTFLIVFTGESREAERALGVSERNLVVLLKAKKKKKLINIALMFSFEHRNSPHFYVSRFSFWFQQLWTDLFSNRMFSLQTQFLNPLPFIVHCAHINQTKLINHQIDIVKQSRHWFQGKYIYMQTAEFCRLSCWNPLLIMLFLM